MRSELLFMCSNVVNNFVSFILMLMQIVNKSIPEAKRERKKKQFTKELNAHDLLEQ